jgi:hypothetical protein
MDGKTYLINNIPASFDDLIAMALDLSLDFKKADHKYFSVAIMILIENGYTIQEI